MNKKVTNYSLENTRDIQSRQCCVFTNVKKKKNNMAADCLVLLQQKNIDDLEIWFDWKI